MTTPACEPTSWPRRHATSSRQQLQHAATADVRGEESEAAKVHEEDIDEELHVQTVERIVEEPIGHQRVGDGRGTVLREAVKQNAQVQYRVGVGRGVAEEKPLKTFVVVEGLA